MFRVLMELLLRAAFPVPLFWAYAYPTWSGDISFHDIRLGKPALLSASSARVDLEWGSLLGEDLRINQISAKDIVAEFPIDDPAVLLECLSGKNCKRELSCSKKVVSAGPPKTSSSPGTADESKREKKIARLSIGSLRAEGGSITFCQGPNSVHFGIRKAEADGLEVPLNQGSFEARAEIVLLDGDTLEPKIGGLPIQAKLTWNPRAGILNIEAEVKDFPLVPLARLFPKLVEARQSSGITLPLSIGHQVVVQEIRKEVTVSGTIELAYDPSQMAGKRWSVKLP